MSEQPIEYVYTLWGKRLPFETVYNMPKISGEGGAKLTWKRGSPKLGGLCILCYFLLFLYCHL